MANFVVDNNKNLGHVPPSMLYVYDFSEREEFKRQRKKLERLLEDGVEPSSALALVQNELNCKMCLLRIHDRFSDV